MRSSNPFRRQELLTDGCDMLLHDDAKLRQLCESLARLLLCALDKFQHALHGEAAAVAEDVDLNAASLAELDEEGTYTG
jgi:hypothetical protein